MQKSNGDWVPCHAYRKLPDGTVQVLTEADGTREANTGKKRIPNVSQGFFANGVFHPIRASWDYDNARAGEPEWRVSRKPEKRPAGTTRVNLAKKQTVRKVKPKPKPKRKPPANRGTSRSRVYPGD